MEAIKKSRYAMAQTPDKVSRITDEIDQSTLSKPLERNELKESIVESSTKKKSDFDITNEDFGDDEVERLDEQAD
jgi:hypothetical protein